jgi:hypothetical protein
MYYGGLRRGEIQIWPFVGLGIRAGFGVFMAVLLKISVVWNVKLSCWASTSRHFERSFIFRFELSVFTFIYLWVQ